MEIPQQNNIQEEDFLIQSLFKRNFNRNITFTPAENSQKFYSFQFELEELNIRLTKRLKKYDEGLIFRLKFLQFSLITKSSSLEVKSQIRELGVDLINNFEAKNEIIIPILKKNEDFQRKKHCFLSFQLQKSLNILSLEMEIGAIEIIYYPSIMLKLMAYFNVQSSEEGVKNLAFEEYQRLQKQASNSFECTGKKSLEVAIRIKIASPSLIIPFLQYNDLQSPCFVLDLGDIELHNEDNTNFFQKKEEYQHFLLNFSAIQLFFYSSITYFYMIKKYGEISDFPDFLNSGNVKNEQFQIIENMKLKSRIQKLKVSNKDRPTAKVFIEFENVSINCSPKTFSDLLNFKKYFDNPDFRTQELLQTEMKSLFENAYRKGMLKKKESTFKNWSNYYAVFSGGYLYFFFSQKDLKYSSYLYIKDSIVKECSNEIGIPFSFKISSKLNDTFLACGSQNDLKLWVKILQKKIHEFSFKGHQFSVQNNRKSEINTKPNDINQINLYLTAHIISIQLNFLDYSLQKSMQASFSNISIRFTQRLLDFELLLSMESILFQDFLEKYAYPEIGTLLSSKDKEFLEVTVKSLEKNNPLYRNTDFEVILRISDLDIHWKAKTIVLLMKFLLEEPEFNIEILNEIANSNNVSPKQFNSSPQAHKEIKGLRDFAKKLTAKREELLEDENPFDLSQTFNQENNLILSINISLKGFELHMLPKNVSLAILEIPKFEGVFLMKAETMQIKMKIWGLQIREMTNYPETKIRFCKKENSIKLLNDDNSIEIQYISFDNNSKLMKNNISSKITIEINKLQLLWLQQPIFRINDYLNEEIIGPLTFDYKTPTLIKEDIRYIISLLKKPRFSLMSLSLIDTSLILKGNPKDFESLLLTIEEIDIKSFQEKTKNRIERVIPTELHNIFIKGKEGNLNWNEGVWQECYAISLNGCQLSYRANQRDKVYYITNNTKPLVGSLVIEKLFMGEECSKILQEEGGFYSVDKTMRVLSAFEPLDLRFQYESYQYLMRVLMNNLSYDDKKDMVFSNKGLEVLKEPKNPIQFIMDFSPLRLLLENFNPNIEKQYNLSGLPFAELSFISNRLIYERDLLSNTKIRLFFLDFRAESFEYLDDNHEGYKVFITGFLRALFQKSLSLPLFLKQRRIRAPTEKEINNDELPYNKDNLVSKLRTRKYYTNQARFSLEVLTGVERTLSFSIHNFLFLLNAGFLTNLLSYMSPKEEPTLNPSLKTTEDKPKKMTIDLTIRNALFCLQTSGDNEENILALQALIQIKYIKNHCNPSCTLHTSFHQDYKNSDSRLFNPYFRDFTSSFLLISLTKLELFNCNKEDLLAKTEDSDIWMLEIRKRALLQPSSLKYESEECLCHCVKSLQTQLKDSKLILGPTRVNFSFKDLFLINETSDWQKKELEKARKSENKGLFRKKSYEGSEEEDLKEDFEEEEEDLYINSEEGIKIPLERGEKIDIDRRSGLNMKSDKIEMILIDDIGKTLIPVVQMCCLLKSLQQESIETKQMYKGEFDLSLFYYNPSSGKLEPILENTSLILCYLANPLSNPKIYLTFELQPLLNPKTSLNLIFSEEMISGLLKTYWSLEREQLLFKKPELQTREIQKNLPYEGKFLRKNTTSKKYYRDYMKYVSIYSISNETGYDLELLRDEAKLQISLNFQRSYITGLSSRNPLDERLNARTLVRNGETENFEVHSDETNFEKTFHKSHTISIVFRAVSGQEIEIPNIELNRIRRKRYYWSNNSNGLNRRFFIGEVRILGSRKDLLLTSSVVFRNNLNKKLFILLKSPRFKGLQMEVPGLGKRGCPGEYGEEMGSFVMKVLDEEEYYTKSVCNYLLSYYY